ncbi:mitochondrial nucleoid-associated protein 1 isoform X2 [Columba livia]|uniref:mitochondrial nucleoid-associated protein 1 isoform X2 n=1 Tax=Columba livia TaxID=8932 RepID=UPI0031BA5AB5
MAAAPGQQLCPHCRRPFKRLRSHLPHCKAAPGSAPASASGPSSGLGPGPAAGPPEPGRSARAGSRGGAGKSSKQPRSPGVRQGLPGATPREGPAPQGGVFTEQNVEPSVQDVARSLDLRPEEVRDVPKKLSDGVKIVIEKHRARVVREKSGSRSRGAAAGSPSTAPGPVGGPDPGSAAAHADTAQPDPREGITVPEAANTETRGRGAAESTSASSKGGRGSRLKATKIPVLQGPPDAECRNSPSDLVQQEGIDKTVTEEKQMYREVGVGYKTPLCALQTKSLHPSVTEGFGGHNEGTSKNYLTSTQALRESEEQMAGVSEPILNARRDTELALHQFLLHTSKSQPICLSPAPARGLEWFPDLYPTYHGLSIFPGNHSQENLGSTVKMKGSFSEEQQAWSSYYNKYINVKRGGPAGISMLLAGYCLLSYSWSYQRLKRHRWRKYH